MKEDTRGSVCFSNISELVRPATPRRVASCGYQTALTVLLHNDPADYYSAAVASYGSMVSSNISAGAAGDDSRLNPPFFSLVALSVFPPLHSSGLYRRHFFGCDFFISSIK